MAIDKDIDSVIPRDAYEHLPGNAICSPAAQAILKAILPIAPRNPSNDATAQCSMRLIACMGAFICPRACEPGSQAHPAEIVAHPCPLGRQLPTGNFPANFPSSNRRFFHPRTIHRDAIHLDGQNFQVPIFSRYLTEITFRPVNSFP